MAAKPNPREDLFDLFVSTKREGRCIELKGLLYKHGASKSVNVPGYQDPIQGKVSIVGSLYKLPSAVSRAAQSAILTWLLDLHASGWSFNGNFEFEDFVVAPVTGGLKMRRKKKKDLVQLIKKGKGTAQELDFRMAAEIIQKGIFSKEVELPSDTSHLLSLLHNYQDDYEHLIVSHPALKDEIEILSLFGSLYVQLQQLAKTDPTMHDRIISSLPYCNLDEHHWKIKGCYNKYAVHILSYENPIKKARKSMATGQSMGSTKKTKKRKRGQQGTGGQQGTVQPQVPVPIPSIRSLKIKVQEAKSFSKLVHIIEPDLVFLIPSEIISWISSNEVSQQPADPTVSGPYERTQRQPRSLRQRLFRFVIRCLGFDDYSDGGVGMLKELRNTIQHLIPGASVQQVVGQTVVHFTTRQLEHIYGSIRPALVGHFQEAMNRENQLEFGAPQPVSLREYL